MQYAKKEYGVFLYGDATLTGDEEESIDLMQYLPQYWQNVEHMKRLQETLGKELWRLKKVADELTKQMFVETATWGLDRWERIYGLPTDHAKSVAQRREQIKARIRGSGTITRQMIINVASAFAGGEATVAEYPKEGRFTIKFVGVKGVPANMQGLTEAIEMIKPAHLAFDYAYTYNYWDNLSVRWADINTYTWTQVKTV